jgi:hypothetical protein
MSDEAEIQARIDAAVKSRVAELSEKHKRELETVRGELRTALDTAARHEKAAARVTELEGEITKRDRDALFTEVGIKDETVRGRVQRWFELAQSDVPEAERLAFDVWLREHAPKDDVIGHLFVGQPAGGGTGGGAGAGPGTGGARPVIPNPTGGSPTQPGPRPTKLTKADFEKQHREKLAAASSAADPKERMRLNGEARAYFRQNQHLVE